MKVVAVTRDVIDAPKLKKANLIKIITDFDHSKKMCVQIELEEGEDLIRSYNSLYQANKRLSTKNHIVISRINNNIYMSKE